MVHDTDIIELELKSKKFTLNLRKKEAVLAELAASAPAPPAQPMVCTCAAYCTQQPT